MNNFSALLQQGNAWLFIPSAILLGALHGLEPGHSKTMMAAFIVAIRGTVTQAALLGIAATISHTAVVWAVAMAGLYIGRDWNVESSEPYFQLASAVLIIGVAVWMMWRTRAEQRRAHELADDHHHDRAESKLVDTGHGVMRLAIVEDGGVPRFRLSGSSGEALHWPAHDIALEIERPDGRKQGFTFAPSNGTLASLGEIAEPHTFEVRLQLGHGGHTHAYAVTFDDHHEPSHTHAHPKGLDVAGGGYQDAHELAHANDIRRRFANRHVTTGQIALFGLTGGLIPCPASITVLLICLQLKKITLGAVLVLCFSIGLALTLVLTGAAAALSVRHLSKCWTGFGEIARRAPYVSGAIIHLVGLYIGYSGWSALPR